MSASARRSHGRSCVHAPALAGIGIALILAGCSSTTAGRPQQRGTSERIPTPASASSSSTAAPPIRGAAFIDPLAVHTALSDAAGDIVAANTYDYRNLADYRRTALAVTTGGLTRSLASTIDDIIAKNAPRLHARQAAKVDRIGIANMHGDDATVLMYGQLTVRNTSYPSGRTDPFDIIAGIQRVQRHWLLTRLVTGGSTPCDPPGTAALSDARA